MVARRRGLGVTRRPGPEELLERLAAADRPPEDLAEVVREVTDYLGTAEIERHQLLSERAEVTRDNKELRSHLEDLTGRMTALQAERGSLHRALSAAEQQRTEAEQRAEMFRDRAAGAMAALTQARDELARARAREAARTERARARRAVPDAGGYDGLRPNPLSTGTPVELIGMLQEFRTWAGNPSYRDMALRSGRRVGASTMCTLLRGTELPDRLEVIDAIVEGCGGTDEDRQRFATAWRKLAVPGILPVPASEPRLRAVRTKEDGAVDGDGRTRRSVRRIG